MVSAVAVLGTAIPAAPGYVGTYELAATAAGTGIALAPEAALAVGVLVHAVTRIPLTIAGIVAFITMDTQTVRTSDGPMRLQRG